jgi:hypothetical protein
MSAAAALLDRLGRPGGVRLGSAHGETVPRLPTGLPLLDDALGGGLPRGRVTELAGPRSTGRTGLACAIAAGATRAAEAIAWVDADDALDPDTADAAGVALARTLWVRPRNAADALRATDILLRAGGFGLVVLDLGERARARPAVTQPTGGTTLLVVTPRRQGGPFVALTLELTGRRARWSGGSGRLVLLDGIDVRVTVARSRVGQPGRTLVVREACAG